MVETQERRFGGRICHHVRQNAVMPASAIDLAFIRRVARESLQSNLNRTRAKESRS